MFDNANIIGIVVICKFNKANIICFRDFANVNADVFYEILELKLIKFTL